MNESDARRGPGRTDGFQGRRPSRANTILRLLSASWSARGGFTKIGFPSGGQPFHLLYPHRVGGWRGNECGPIRNRDRSGGSSNRATVNGELYFQRALTLVDVRENVYVRRGRTHQKSSSSPTAVRPGADHPFAR